MGQGRRWALGRVVWSGTSFLVAADLSAGMYCQPAATALLATALGRRGERAAASSGYLSTNAERRRVIVLARIHEQTARAAGKAERRIWRGLTQGRVAHRDRGRHEAGRRRRVGLAVMVQQVRQRAAAPTRSQAPVHRLRLVAWPAPRAPNLRRQAAGCARENHSSARYQR
jgi:hypothetical protein